MYIYFRWPTGMYHDTGSLVVWNLYKVFLLHMRCVKSLLVAFGERTVSPRSVVNTASTFPWPCSSTVDGLHGDVAVSIGPQTPVGISRHRCSRVGDGLFGWVDVRNLHLAHVDSGPLGSRSSTGSLPALCASLLVSCQIERNEEQEVRRQNSHAGECSKLFTRAPAVTWHIGKVCRREICVGSEVNKAWNKN